MKEHDKTLLVMAVVGLIAIYFVAQNLSLNIEFPDFNFPGGNGQNQTPSPSSTPSPTSTPQSGNSLVPTSLYASVSPNPVVMNRFVYGSVVGNGYNTPITIYAKLLGDGTQQSFGGLLNADGRFELVQQLSTPGYWQFWVEAGSVKSNTVSLTCEGIRLWCESGTYSKTFRDSLIMKIYSNFHGNAAIIANDPAHSVSYPVTNCAVNSNGYGTVAPSLDFLPNGNYELDVILAGHKATEYEGSFWVTVGR